MKVLSCCLCCSPRRGLLGLAFAQNRLDGVVYHIHCIIRSAIPWIDLAHGNEKYIGNGCNDIQ